LFQRSWAADPSKVRASGESVLDQLRNLFKVSSQDRLVIPKRKLKSVDSFVQQDAPGISSVDIDLKSALDRVYKHWKDSFDPINAGFGGAPKVV